MGRVLGWDVGGAHLKAALAEGDEILKVWRVPTPLGLDLKPFEAALDRIAAEAGAVERHAATMTGELSDVFPGRSAGVAALAAALRGRLGGAVAFYGGPAGLLGEPAERVASANWHAPARLVAERIDSALLLAMGSTATDIAPLADGEVKARGFGDAERLGLGELVYQGYSRTALMAVAGRVPFAGARVPVIAEPLATMGDVRRLIEPPDAEDEAADATARARLARMIGRDADDLGAEDFARLANAFAEAQLRRIHDAALTVLSRGDLDGDAPVVAAGVGRSVLKRLATRLDRGVVDFADLVECRSAIREAVAEAAAAAALAIIAGRD